MFRVAIWSTLLLSVVVRPAFAVFEEEKNEKPAEYVGYARAAESAVDRWVSTVRKIESYSDEAVVEFKSGFGFGGNEQKATFLFRSPDLFRINTMMSEMISDGKELTIHRRGNRRYMVEKLENDKLTQLRRHGLSMSVQFSLPELFLGSDPKTYVAEHLRDLKPLDNETLDDDKCSVFEGRLVDQFGADTEGRKIKLFLRDKDSMLRRLEVDMSETPKEDDDDDENAGFFRQAMNMKVNYDIKNMKVNEDVAKDRFAFKPPSGSKKVDQFFNSWVPTGGGAQQFALSGKPAPDFELGTTSGKKISMSDMKGKVVVLNFLPETGGRMGRRMARRFGGTPPLDKFDELRRDFADKGVRVICVYPSDSADDLVEELKEKGHELDIALDPDRFATSEYFEERWASGVVLVGKDGVVQGRHAAFMGDEQVKALRSDVEKLLAGESLPGGKPMSDEQLHEAEEQQSSFFLADSAESLNEDRITENWSVRAVDDRAMGFGFGGSSLRGKSTLWIRAKDMLQEVDPTGKVVAEIPVPRVSSGNDFGQEQFAVGRMAGRRVCVQMSSVPGEDSNPFGFRPPKAAVIVAGDESGNELWTMEMEVKNQQMPQHLTLADVDGKSGDELLFTQQGTLHVVSERGETLVRYPLSGWATWVRAEDLDRDDKAEIYVRTSSKLQRFEYKGK